MMKHKPQSKTSSDSDSGFTIIESLIAIVVVAILLAATAPVLVMATAIRVQSKRIEKATQAANTFIDGVETGSVPAPTAIPTPFAAPTSTRTLASNPGDYLINKDQMPVPTSTTSLYLFQKDGIICSPSCTSQNLSEEFYIQSAQIKVTNSASTAGYRLAIRVYRADVDFSKTLLASSKDSSGNTTKTVESPIIAGLGNKQAPLVERTVDIGNSSTSFVNLCSRLGMAKDTAGNNQACQ